MSKYVRTSLREKQSSLPSTWYDLEVTSSHKMFESLIRYSVGLIAAYFQMQIPLEIPSVIHTLIREGEEPFCFLAKSWQRLFELIKYELAEDGR